MILLQTNSIAHRDINPDNIYFDDDLYKIDGFINCKNYETHPQMNHDFTVDHPIFQCPNMIMNKTYNIKSDVFSFGIIVFMLIYKM